MGVAIISGLKPKNGVGNCPVLRALKIQITAANCAPRPPQIASALLESHLYTLLHFQNFV
jgi:hypothetical protein